MLHLYFYAYFFVIFKFGFSGSICLAAALAAHYIALPFRTLAEQLIHTKAQLDVAKMLNQVAEAGHASLEGMRLSTIQKYTVHEIRAKYDVLLKAYAAEQAVC